MGLGPNGTRGSSPLCALGDGPALVTTLACGTGAGAALARGARASAPPIAATDNHGATHLIVFLMVLLPFWICCIQPRLSFPPYEDDDIAADTHLGSPLAAIRPCCGGRKKAEAISGDTASAKVITASNVDPSPTGSNPRGPAEVIAAESTVIAAVEATAVVTATVIASGNNLTRHGRRRVHCCRQRRLGRGRWRRNDGDRCSARCQHRCDVGQFHSHNRTFVMAGLSPR